MESIEFRVSPDGSVYFTEAGQRERRLSRFEKRVCLLLCSIIRERFPGAWSRLRILYPQKSHTSSGKDKAMFSAIERFVRCNFGEHDLLTPDIEHDILNFEEVRCPLRGICPDENVICKPQSLVRLTSSEREVARLYLRGDTFDQIASVLGKSPNTVKVQLHNIKKKTGAKNCREIIKVIRFHHSCP